MEIRSNIRFYQGRSMTGTFRPADCLQFEPESLGNIFPGDIVIFRKVKSSGEAEELVHRVVGRTSDRLFTRGDNNSYIDDSLVTTDNLVGKVTHVERRGKKRRVRSGLWGLLRARILHHPLFLKRSLMFFLKRAYNILKRSGIVLYLWHPVFKRILFKTDKGLLVKYLCGKRTVASWWPEQGYFQCKKPYDLVLHGPDLSNLYKK